MARNPRDTWKPSPLLAFSAGVHAAAALALTSRPGRRHWRSIVGLLALNHAAICVAGMVPRGRLLGPNLSRLDATVDPAPHGEPADPRPSVALTFDDGPDADVTPRVLDLLDAHGAQASFFCIGQRAERLPELTREIVRRGHRVENHTYSHPNSFAFHGPRTMAAQIDRAQDVLGELTGRSPRYFRAPAGIRNPWLDPLLHRRALTLASWTRRGFDTVDRNARRVERRLLRGLRAGDILLLHDTAGVRSSATLDPAHRSVTLQVLPRLLAALDAAGLRGTALPLDGPTSDGPTSGSLSIR